MNIHNDATRHVTALLRIIGKMRVVELSIQDWEALLDARKAIWDANPDSDTSP